MTFVSVDTFFRCNNAKWQSNRLGNMLLLVGTVADLLSLGIAGAFDAALVDGDHHYEPCLTDLVACERLLKPGAPLLAHDYEAVPGTSVSGKEGVKRAVNEFAAARGYRVDRPAGSLARLVKQQP